MNRHVAIVEDSPAEAELLRSYFARFTREHGVEFTLTCFASGEEFLNKYRPAYDLVLMDIGLPGHNGMETAAALRERDRSVTLIFVTNMAQFAVKGYEVDAFDFVVKPVGYSNFALKLQRALNKLDTRRDTEVLVTLSDSMVRLAASQIKYIEISGHRMVYHTTDGELYAYGNLKEVEATLGGGMFARCNNCYLVNLNYVRAVQGHTVTVGTDELQISRPRRKAFIQALNDYLGGGIG